jgi:hypothetical protein
MASNDCVVILMKFNEITWPWQIIGIVGTWVWVWVCVCVTMSICIRILSPLIINQDKDPIHAGEVQREVSENKGLRGVFIVGARPVHTLGDKCLAIIYRNPMRLASVRRVTKFYLFWKFVKTWRYRPFACTGQRLLALIKFTNDEAGRCTSWRSDNAANFFVTS